MCIFTTCGNKKKKLPFSEYDDGVCVSVVYLWRLKVLRSPLRKSNTEVNKISLGVSILDWPQRLVDKTRPSLASPSSSSTTGVNNNM